MDEVDLAREAGDEARLLHGRVAAADDRHDLVAEEGRIARRAVRDAATLQPELGFESELARRRAGRDDDGLCRVLLVADVHAVRLLGEVDSGHVVGQELGAEALGLRAEVLHHLRAEDTVPIARIVLDVARDHQLAAPVEALDHERLQVGARGVQRGRVAGRTTADDDHLVHVTHLVSRLVSVLSTLTIENASERPTVPRAEA